MRRFCKTALAAGLIAALTALAGCGNDLGNLEEPPTVNPLAALETPFTVTVPSDLGGGFWVTGGYLYYFDPSNAVKAINLADPEETVTALTLTGAAVTDQGITQVGYNIGQRNGVGHFYITRNWEEGEYTLYRVDGGRRALEQVERGETRFGDVTVVVEDSRDESKAGNLFLQTKDGKRGQIGDPSLHYMLTYGRTENAPSSQVYRVGEEAILIAVSPEGGEYQLCKVNMKNGRHTTLWEPYYSIDSDLRIDGEYLYLLAPREEDGSGTVLEKICVTDGTAEEVPLVETDSLNSGAYAALGGMVYYQNGYDSGRPPLTAPPGPDVDVEQRQAWQEEYDRIFEEWQRRVIPDQELYRTGEATSLSPGREVMQLERQGNYIVCRFNNWTADGETDGVSLAVFNEEGDQVFETVDGIGTFCVDGDTLVYSLYGDEDPDWSNKTCRVRVVNLK